MRASTAHEGSLSADERDWRLGPEWRLELLCDPGSVQVIRSAVRSRRLGDAAHVGDGVIGLSGSVNGRPVFCYAQDDRVAGGSLGEVHADTILRVMGLAREARAPVVGFVASAGARMQEGTAGLSGYGRIFHETVQLSGRVPQISVVTGVSAGGGCYSPALTDFVVMTRESRMFLTGPKVVRDVLGEDVTAEELGAYRVHGRNGVCHFVAEDETEATLLVRDLLSYLPQNAWEAPPRAQPDSAPGDPGAPVPKPSRQVYDVRDVARAIVDGGRLLEVAPRWARNIVTAFCRIDGRSVGIVANQPRHLGGIIDVHAAQKGARFVRTCNAFGVPVLALVDTPGFMPGTRQEVGGLIRHGAKLVHAFAEATVAKLTVVLRKAYGGAFITMNSKDLGAHYVYAWPSAEIGVMGAQQAVSIIDRRRLAAASDPDGLRRRLAAEYRQEHLHAGAAASDGFVDEVIAPDETRSRLSAALTALERLLGPVGGRGNIPL